MKNNNPDDQQGEHGIFENKFVLFEKSKKRQNKSENDLIRVVEAKKFNESDQIQPDDQYMTEFITQENAIEHSRKSRQNYRKRIQSE